MLLVCALSFIAAMISVALTPLLLGRLYAASHDYSRLSDIGQAYGAASAVIATVALGVVLAGLMLQYRQFTASRLQALTDAEDQLILIAMKDPHYRQCWGALVAPADVDEGDYYYCNMILTNWKRAWQLRDLSEAQVRAYLVNFFESEISRRFWRDKGDWHKKVKPAGRRARLIEIINEEYLRAEKSGPPSRPYEPRTPAQSAPRSRRQDLVNADQTKDRTIIS
ncbi:DUF6082 family protein [Patulibacter sp. NPDC049589]|uniref:DUF6082 family protein n=1 Tax=Patulibacter sp. NPDC049589 TaxID=3154731 RepID=UPI0034408F9D